MHRIVLNKSEKPEDWRVFPSGLAACQWAINNARNYSTLDLHYVEDEDKTSGPGTFVGTFSVEGILHVYDLVPPLASPSAQEITDVKHDWHMYFSLVHMCTCGFVFLTFVGAMINALAKRLARYSQ